MEREVPDKGFGSIRFGLSNQNLYLGRCYGLSALIDLSSGAMTTFQSIVYAIIHGITPFLPVSTSAHDILIPYCLGWQPAPEALLSIMTISSALSLLVFFRHDWASMISCLLQVILFRKKPMTLDERLPLFIGISLLPILLISPYLFRMTHATTWNPLIVTLIFAGVGFPLWFFDSMSRRNKGVYDWNWLDALIVGGIGSLTVVPGFDLIAGLLIAGLFLNYRKETAAKYAYFVMFPILLIRGISTLKELDFHSSLAAEDLSWLSFGIAGVITFLIGLLTLGGFMKHIQQKGLAQYSIYRWVVALGVCLTYWIRSQS